AEPVSEPGGVVENGVLVADPAGPGVVDVAGAADQAGVLGAKPLVQPSRAQHLRCLGTTWRRSWDRWAQAQVRGCRQQGDSSHAGTLSGVCRRTKRLSAWPKTTYHEAKEPLIERRRIGNEPE